MAASSGRTGGGFHDVIAHPAAVHARDTLEQVGVIQVDRNVLVVGERLRGLASEARDLRGADHPVNFEIAVHTMKHLLLFVITEDG